MGSDALLVSLRAAVQAAPQDVVLRMHLAKLLADVGDRVEAVRHAAVVLQQDPANSSAIALISRSTDSSDVEKGVASPDRDSDQEAETLRWLESELADIAPPRYIDDKRQEVVAEHEVDDAALRLSDVAGMAEVKKRLEAAVLASMRSPELTRLYGKSLRGGLLLYGPPGCGKTFISRALAGELDAGFLAISLADVLDMYVGQSERNIRGIFETARRNAPCVIFLDEIDALGQKRSQLRGSAARARSISCSRRWTAPKATRACS